MKCIFLSTVDEDVECFKECELYRWSENSNKCPFTELKGRRSKSRRVFDYDEFKDEEDEDDLTASIIYDKRSYI